MTRRNSHLPSCLAALAALALAGCADTTNVSAALTTNKTVTVETVHHRFSLAAAEGSESDWQSAMRRFAGFSAGLQPDGRTRLVVQRPPVMSAEAERRMTEFVAGLRARGFRPAIATDETQPATLHVGEATANVSGCPNWSRPDFGYLNAQSSNYGCATQSILAVMLDDPRDLLEPREAGPDRGTGAWLDMQRYHTGEKPPLEVLETNR